MSQKKKKKHSKTGLAESGQYDQLSSLNTPNPVHPEDLNDEEESASSPSVAEQRQLAMAGSSSSAAQKGRTYSTASSGDQAEGGVELADSSGKKGSKWPLSFRKSKKDKEKEKEKGKQSASKGKSEQVKPELTIESMQAEYEKAIEDLEAKMKDQEKDLKAKYAEQLEREKERMEGENEKLKAELAEELDREKRGMEEDKENWKTKEMQTWKAKEEKWNEVKQQELTALTEAKQKLEEKLEESSKQLEEVNQKLEEKKQTDSDMKNRNELMLEMTTKTVQAKDAEIDKLKAILESKTKQHQEEMTKQAEEMTKQAEVKADELKKQAEEFTEQQRIQQSKMENLARQLREEKTQYEQERENLVRENSERLEKQLEEEKGRHQQEKEGLLLLVENHQESLRLAKEEWTKQLNQQLEQTEQIKDELTQRLKEEGDQKVADIANSLKEMEGERDRVNGELEVVHQDLLKVQRENAELAKQLEEVRVKGELGEVGQDLERVQAENAVLVKQLEEEGGVKGELEKVRQDLGKVRTENAELAKQLKVKGELEENLQAANAKLAKQLKEKEDGVKGELDEVRQDLERVQAKNTELAKVKGELEIELQNVRAENAKLAKQKEDGVKGELDEVRQDLERVQAENAKLVKVKGEYEKDLQKVRAENAELENKLKEETEEEEQQLQELKQKHKRAEKEINLLRQKLESEKAKVQQLKEQLEQKMKLSEEETTTTNMKSLLVDEEVCQLHPSPGTTISGPSLAEWNDLKAKVSHLEQQNKELQRIHLDNPVPSNVHQFCHQLSKLVDPEGDSAQTTPRPLPMDTAMQALQLLGVGSDFKSRGYIVSIFTACNKMQSTLLDYTRIGEVVQFKVHDAGVDSGDERSPHSSMNTDKSPYTSLTEVKVEVTDGNMTDADKLDLQQMLMESQKALESLRSEKESLLSEKEGLCSEKESLRSENESLCREKESLMEHIEVLEVQFHLSDARSAPESADTAKAGQGQPKSDAEKLRQMKKNYLKVHNEMMQLMEKVKERDDQLKKLRDGFGKTDNPPVNNQDPHQQPSDLPSPEDPRAEVDKLRATLDEREERIHNLTMQLRSLQGLGRDKLCYEAQITKLNESLAAANAEIEKLKAGQTFSQEAMKQKPKAPTVSEVTTQDDRAESDVEVSQLREELEAARAEIKKLRDESELAQAYTSLNKEFSSVRNHLQTAEGDKRDLEAEVDVWKQEVSAERENNQKLKTEVAQLRAAVNFWEKKQPEAVGDPLQESLSREKVFVGEMHQIEVADLRSKLAAKEASIKSAVASRNTLESRLQRCMEERDGLAQQNIELLAVKANLKGHFEGVKHDVASLQGLATRLQNSLTVKTTELESCKKEKELMIKEIKTLQDEIEAWKQEVAVIKEDFQLERSDREKYASTRDDETKNWHDEKQRYEATIKHLNHEFEQREFQLTQKLKEMTTRNEKALKCQRETDQLCDQLREERDTFHMEMQRTHELYEEKRQHHKDTVQQLEGEKEHLSAHLQSLKDKLQLIEVQNCSMQSMIAQLEDEKKKSESIHETTAAMKRQVDAKLQEVTAKLRASEQQSQLYFAELQQQGRKLEEYIANISKVSDELMSVTQDRNHYKTQSEGYKAKFQEEKKRIRHLEQEMHKLEEGHREEVDYIKAQYEDKMIEQDRQMIPMRRELEQLRTQTFSEGQHAETFRMMEQERKELKQTIETLEKRNHELLDDVARARGLLLEKNVPLPRRQGQDRQRQPQETIASDQSSIYVRPYVEPPTLSDGSTMPPLHRLGDYSGRENLKSFTAQQARASNPAAAASRTNNIPPHPVSVPSVDPRAGLTSQSNNQLQYQQNMANYPGSSAAPTGRGQEQYPPRAGAPQQQGGGVVSQSSAYDSRPGQRSSMPAPQQQPGQLRAVDYHQPHSPSSPHLHYHQQQPQPPANSAQSCDPHQQRAMAPQQGGYQQPPPQQQPPANNAQSCDPRAVAQQGGGYHQAPPPQSPSPPQAKPRPPNPTVENPLMKSIDAEIVQAAANVQREAVVDSINPNEEAWPLDSNLVCPMCKKQFRIGQIQIYKKHVDKCSGV